MRTRVANILLLLFMVTSTQTLHAQIDQLTMNYTEIKVDYSPQDGATIPFGIDLVITPDDSAVIKLPGRPRVTDVTLKRGVIGAELSHFEFLVSDAGSGQWPRTPLGILRLDARQDTARSGMGVDLLNASDVINAPATLEITRIDEAPPKQLSLQWQPPEGVRLAGEPAAYFNVPRTGAPLVATIPVAAPGSSVEHTLRVVRADALDRWESTLQIRIHRAQ